MGKTQKVRISDGPGQRPYTAQATAPEPDRGFPAVDETVHANQARPEAYGFGKTAVADTDGASGAQSDEPRPDMRRADGFDTIKGALAAERVAETRTEVGSNVNEPVALDADGDTDGDTTTPDHQVEETPAADDDTEMSQADNLPGALSAADRDALVAHVANGVPQAVRALVGGGTVQEILASATRAQQVHDNIANTLRAQTPVSAGGAPRGTLGPELSRMSPVQKIAHGVREARASR